MSDGFHDDPYACLRKREYTLPPPEFKAGDKVEQLADSYAEPLTVRESEVTDTGEWLSFMEHNLNKYGVYPKYLSNKFKKVYNDK